MVTAVPGEEHPHEHILPDGTRWRHTHAHSHKQTKAVLTRLNTVIGHLQGVANMVTEGRDCSDVLVQLGAVSASIRKLKILILQDHVEHCVAEAIREGDDETMEKLSKAIARMLD